MFAEPNVGERSSVGSQRAVDEDRRRLLHQPALACARIDQRHRRTALQQREQRQHVPAIRMPVGLAQIGERQQASLSFGKWDDPAM